MPDPRKKMQRLVVSLDEALQDRISACVPADQPDFLAGLLLSERVRDVRDLAGMLPRLTPQEFASLPENVAEKPLTPFEICMAATAWCWATAAKSLAWATLGVG